MGAEPGLMSGLVLITGATGFVGRALVADLARRGWRVVAVARNPRACTWPPNVATRFMPDLSRPADLGPLLDRATHVVHLAGIAHATRALPEAHYTAVNTEGATLLARAARAAGVRRFVLLSSVRAQSGPSAAGVLTEADAARPTDSYGRSKLAAEHAIAETLAGSATEWVVLRPVLVYGRGAKGNMGTLARLAQMPVPLPLAGLEGRRSLLGQANLASAVAHVLTAPAAAGRTFLVADPEPALTVGEIVAAIRAGAGRQPGLLALPEALRAGLARAPGVSGAWQRLSGDLVVDPSALRATGWTPVQSTRDGLADLLRR